MTTTEPAPDVETDEVTETALVRQVRTLVSKSKSFSAAELLSTVAGIRKAATGAVVEIGRDTPLPKGRVALSPESKSNLTEVVDFLDGLSLPETHRLLTPRELEALTPKYKLVTALAAQFKDAGESIKVAVNNHLNLKAEREGLVGDETEQDTHGNWAVEVDTADDVPEADLRFNRGYRKPSVDIDPDILLDLKNSGEITTAVYNKVTRPVRSVDEHGFSSAIVRDPALIDVLSKAIVTTSAPQTPLTVGRNTTKTKKAGKK
jgi:hypothetical protein